MEPPESTTPQRVLATILLTDIVGSTRRAAELGDARWRELLVLHDAIVREQVTGAGGRVVKSLGDGSLCVLGGPAQAIRCAEALRDRLAGEGIPIRAGIHTGECEVIGDDVGGMAVHIAARVAGSAERDEIRVSSTVADLVAGSGMAFTPLGEHELKGVPGSWRLLAVGEGQPNAELPGLRRGMRAVVAEDTMITRRGLVMVLENAGVDVIAEAEDAERLMQYVRTRRPDVAIVDIKMPPTHTDEGLVAAQAIRADYPETAVLVLSHYVEPSYAQRLVEEHPEGVGYLLKERVFDPVILIDALRRITDGETIVDPTLVSRLIGRQRHDDPLEELTGRERETLGLVAEGRSNKAIAEQLFITPRTVEAHVKQIFHKLGIQESPEDHRRVLAVIAFLRA
ncbi:MAG: hypothetical protein QOH46_1745 [Solirubrobacteraceae bacterium]|nr:hypothetical protein [Solirubrobacteraceae bacterium]